MKSTSATGSPKGNNSAPTDVKPSTPVEQLKKYDSYRTDSGYNSCSCQSLTSTGSDLGLTLSDSRNGRSDRWDSSLSVGGRPANNISDSGLSLNSNYSTSSLSSGNLNDLNRPSSGKDVNFVSGGVASTSVYSDSGLGLELGFSKLSVDGEQYESKPDLATNTDEILQLARREEHLLAEATDNFALDHQRTSCNNNYDSWRNLKVIEDAFLPDTDGDTYLHLAIVHGRVDIAIALIFLAPHPTYLDLPNNRHQAPLHLAVLTGLKRVVRHLVLAGASLDVRNKIGNTPLHLACERGELELVRELMRPVTYNEMQYLSLTCSAHYSFQDIMVPQNLELQNYEGQTCVHLAAINQHAEVIRHLNCYGANVNAQDGKGGRTPLCYAIEARNPALVSFLVKECQADMHATTYAGTTPFQVAYYMDPDIADLLLAFGAYPQRPAFTDSETDSDGSLEEGMDIGDGEFSSDSYFDLQVNGEPLW